MAYTFDGINKLIILSHGTTYVSVADMYSRWKEWIINGNNSNYMSAMSYIGADPIPGGQLGSTFFLENGWKIRPHEDNHTLTIVGNLYSRDGTDPFVSTLGIWNIRVVSVVSTLVETITQNGVGTVQDVKDAVWGADLSTYGSGTAGYKLHNQLNGLTPTQSSMLLELYQIFGLDPTKPLTVTNTSRTAGTIAQTIVSDSNSTVLTRN